MAEIKYHESQQKILSPKSVNELVSASAGSGKTTIMVQKITDMLTSGQVAPSEIMVVTYTIAAADEMKSRLNANVDNYARQHPEEADKMTAVKDGLISASIGTIHAICLRTIKKYFYALGVNANVNVIEGARDRYFRNQALAQTAQEFDAVALQRLLQIFGNNKRDMSVLFESVESVHDFVASLDDRDEFLNKSEKFYEDENLAKNELLNIAKNTANKYIENLTKLDLDSHEKLDAIRNQIMTILQSINSVSEWDILVLHLQALADINFKGVRGAKEIPDYADLQNILSNIKNNLVKNFVEIKLLNDEEKNNIVEIISYFTDFVRKFSENFEKNKQKFNVLDFNDLELKMLQLLKNNEIANELRQNYKYIFVDEFQDVNSVQGKIVELISNGKNLFLVGDVKQSIYGFRFANPEQFVGLFNDYQNNADLGVAEQMNVNYRTNPKILNFVNQIFNKIMTKENSGIAYKGNSEFEPMRDDIVSPTSVEIDVIVNEKQKREYAQSLPVYSVRDDTDRDNRLTDSIKMAKFVANKISSLINTEIYDTKAKKMRKVEYKDISILSRKLESQKVRDLIEELKSNQLPVTVEQNIDVESSESIQILLSLAKLINYSTADNDYVSAMLSFGGFNFQQLNIIAGEKGETFVDKMRAYSHNDELTGKIAEFIEKISNLRYDLINKSIKCIFESLLYKYGLYNYIANCENGMEEITVVQDFLSSISEDENEKSLADYLLTLDQDANKKHKSTISTSANSITIQTIHKSKGLEYPIVFVIDCGAPYSKTSTTSKIICNAQYGLGIDYYDTDERAVTPTLERCLCEMATLGKEASEEQRLLYVAMTRAQNQLYLVAQTSEKELQPKALADCNSYFANIVYGLGLDLSAQTDMPIANGLVHFVLPDEICFDEQAETEKVKDVNIDSIAKNIAFKYAGVTEQISLKNTITQVTKTLAEDAYVPTKMYTRESIGASAEEPNLGTLYHKALQLGLTTDKAQSYASFKVFAKENGDIEEDLLDRTFDALNPLFTPDCELKKEAQFMMCVPYNSLYATSNATDNVLVQGVVDLIIVTANGLIVVDYKLSSASATTLKARYSPQLQLYARACESAFKKKVKAKYIYSIKSQKLIEIE